MTENALQSQMNIVMSRFDQLKGAVDRQRLRSHDVEYQIDLLANALDSLRRRVRESM